MKENTAFDQALCKSLIAPNALDVVKDIAEISIDSVLEDGLVKEIPVVSWFVNICNTITSIRDRLFLKKLLVFISNLKDTPI